MFYPNNVTDINIKKYVFKNMFNNIKKYVESNDNVCVITEVYHPKFEKKGCSNPFLLFFSNKSGLHFVFPFFGNFDDVLDDLDSFKKKKNRLEKIVENEIKKREIFLHHNTIVFDVNVWIYFQDISASEIEFSLFNSEDKEDFIKTFPNAIPNLIDRNIVDYIEGIETFKNNSKYFNCESFKTRNPKSVYTQLMNTFTLSTLEGEVITDSIKPNTSALNYYCESLMLDDSQIKIVTNTSTGPRIILAKAGTGKSVILFAKAQYFSASHPRDKVLISTERNALNKKLQSQANRSGFNNNNLVIKTTHKIIIDLLRKYGLIETNRQFFNANNGESDTNEIIGLLPKLKKMISVDDQYSAIFIDEIQIYPPEFIEFLFFLLKSKDPNKYLFILSGDINQSVKKRANKGKAPWQFSKDLNFRGNRTIKLEKQYRYCDEISEFVLEVNKNINTLYHRSNLNITDVDLDLDIDIYKNVHKHGRLMNSNYKNHKSISFFKLSKDIKNRTNNIVEQVESLINEGYDESEICIIYPKKCYYIFNGFNRKKVDLIQTLMNVLDEKRFEYNFIKDDFKDDSEATLKLCTCQSAIGLDFKVVLFIGIDSFGTISPYISNESRARKLMSEGKIINNFYEEISELYVGVSRARDRIVIETNDENNIFNKLIVGE